MTPEALRGQRQLAAGDEIELPRLAPDLQHDGAERVAGQRIGRRAQRALDIDARTVTTRRGSRPSSAKPCIDSAPDSSAQKSCRTQSSGRRASPARVSPAKAGRGRAVPAAFGKHLMHRAAREPALQRRIGLAMPERHPVRRERAMGLDAWNAIAHGASAPSCAVPS